MPVSKSAISVGQCFNKAGFSLLWLIGAAKINGGVSRERENKDLLHSLYSCSLWWQNTLQSNHIIVTYSYWAWASKMNRTDSDVSHLNREFWVAWVGPASAPEQLCPLSDQSRHELIPSEVLVIGQKIEIIENLLFLVTVLLNCKYSSTSYNLSFRIFPHPYVFFSVDHWSIIINVPFYLHFLIVWRPH